MSLGSAKVTVRPSTLLHSTTDPPETMPARKREQDEWKYYHEFGFRKMGDELLDLHEDAMQWTTPQDVDLVLRYNAARDQTISHVQIKVDQSSDEGLAKIVAGNIGGDFVEILVTARHTVWFNYEARGYGRPIFMRLHLEQTGNQE